MKINENIAFARSILLKNNIKSDSEEYKDYLEIRRICDRHNGYVGILTKLRFIDNVTDLEELESIFNLLKNSKIDVNKINKLSYDDILTMFYDELVTTKKDSNYELVFKDNSYSYFLVYNYEGILEIGSPSWCLKTKSRWDQYMSKYTHQWVVIHNDYIKKIVSPNNFYLKEYKSSKGWVRYGISTVDKGDSLTWIATDDNNINMDYTVINWTFFGIFNTLINVYKENKKSFYDSFKGTIKEDSPNWLTVTNKDSFLERLKIDKSICDDDDDLYVVFSKDYSTVPLILLLNNNNFKNIFPISYSESLKYKDEWFNKPVEIEPSTYIYKKILEKGKKSKSNTYTGILLHEKVITLDEIKKRKKFHDIIDNWIVYNYENFYLIVNTIIESNETICRYTDYYLNEFNNPFYFIIDKKTKKPSINLPKEKVSNLLNVLFKKNIKDYFSFLNKK
jgi:hypothetical protein